MTVESWQRFMIWPHAWRDATKSWFGMVSLFLQDLTGESRKWNRGQTVTSWNRDHLRLHAFSLQKQGGNQKTTVVKLVSISAGHDLARFRHDFILAIVISFLQFCNWIGLCLPRLADFRLDNIWVDFVRPRSTLEVLHLDQSLRGRAHLEHVCACTHACVYIYIYT